MTIASVSLAITFENVIQQNYDQWNYSIINLITVLYMNSGSFKWSSFR